MSDKTLCPLCGEGHLTPHTDDMVIEHGGQQGTVMLRFAGCDACGSEITGDADSRANKRAVLAFRKSVDSLLTGAEIRALRDKYGITQDQAARLFGGGPKAFSKYEADDVAHAVSMDNLLRLVREDEDAFWNLVAIKGMAAEFPHRTARPATVRPPVIQFVMLVSGAEAAQPVVQRRPIPYRAPHGEINATLQ
ncbi:MAG: type II toxin-antitoxin system MqsA family antitoxin [Rhodocyclaceae bacterium]|nr:type II toxin-antitoxin system MqsA family antitoxin [Rhodocyclaceae bacterium]